MDVTQEAFIKAYRNLKRFDAERPLQPWLLQITANLSRNKRRSIGRYWGAVNRFFKADPERLIVPDHAGQGAEAELLWQAVRRLKRPAQEVIYLRYFLELSEAETADCLEIPKGTVKSRLHRALAGLREIVEAEFPELRGVPLPAEGD